MLGGFLAPSQPVVFRREAVPAQSCQPVPQPSSGRRPREGRAVPVSAPLGLILYIICKCRVTSDPALGAEGAQGRLT